MTFLAPRTCTVVEEGEATRSPQKRTRPLTDCADIAAYVRIAEPGAGKTTSFETEAASQGGTYVTVRNFRTFEDRPEWHDTTLFLDGLDELRAGAEDGRTPLDDIRRKLNRLGCPPFRESCRWADWMAANDRERLKDVSPDGTVILLRLDPLSKQGIKDILAKRHGVTDPNGFIKMARQHGVDKLLTNPQNLEMLAKSVLRGEWPDSRKAMFAQACQMLVSERNGEHLAANPSSTDASMLIEAAGALCAAQLLSGSAGYTLPDRAEPDDEYPSLKRVDREPDGRMRDVLGTRLFVGISEGKLAPAHRQTAEFLAARYVSGRIDHGGLSLGRILALITGFDGEVVPSFINFAGWLAVHNKRSRKRLSQLCPSELIYVGDRQTYSSDEKRDIVLNLRRESYWNPWCSRAISKTRGIGGIVSPELEGTLREVLSEGERNHEHQSYVMLLMQMLTDGEPLPTLADVLEKTVRDRTWNWGVRSAALDALIAYCASGRLGTEALTRMVDEIEDGSLDDPQDALLGILLSALYPKVLSIAKVQRYLRQPKSEEVGDYVDFWTDHVSKESTPEQLAELLDGIAANFEDYKPFLVCEPGQYRRLGQLPIDLLIRVLQETLMRSPGRSVAPDRLYEWLGVASDPGLAVPEWQQVLARVFLECDQEVPKALIAYGVEHCIRKGDDCTNLIDRRLFGVRALDHGRWCLQMALAAKAGKAGSFYLQESLACLLEGARADGLTVEGARMTLAADATLLSQFDEMVGRRAPIEAQPERRTEPGRPTDTESPADSPEQLAWQVEVAADAQALRVGSGSPRLLTKAAEAYLGIHGDTAQKTPRDRLRSLVGSRGDLLDLLLAGMESTVARGDLPSCEDVVRKFDRSRIDLLLLPFVAGLHSLEGSGHLSATDLTESQTRLGVTILYMLPRKYADPDSCDETSVYRPAWFQTLLRDDPALVADTIRRSAAWKLEAGVQPAIELRELGEAEDHRKVAEIAALPVLESFPTADTDVTLIALCWSLKAALWRSDWAFVAPVIEKRLGRGDLAAGERGCWLAAGYLVAPQRFREDLLSLTEDKDGLKWLARFVAAGRFPKDFTRRFAPGDVEPLVAVLGARLRADGLTERAFWSTSEVIDALADDASPAATEALEALRAMPDAIPWAPSVTDARERQARKRREREYRHCEISAVVSTLENRGPANAADLAALVLSELEDISLKIRNGSTSDWRQHWNVDRYNRPTDPKPEDACRDAVLSDLKESLGRLGIDAQPEGVYAEDNRSDIRVAFAGFNVPVEIKRSCHSDLWTAIHDQLIAKYTRDPGAAGYGIYLVFWFGDTEKCRPTKCSGWTPQKAEDVKSKILESLDDRERRLISGCVADVSAPQ